MRRALHNGREGQQKVLGCSHIGDTFLGCDRPCQLATRVIEMLSGCLNPHRLFFSQHACKNAQLSAKKHTKARSHCLFVRVSSQKTLTHGNLAWQPHSGVMRFSQNDNSPHDPFVGILMFFRFFLLCFCSRATRLLAVDAACANQTRSARSTVSFRFSLKEFSSAT